MLFAPTSNASGTELRRDYSRRQKLGRAIAVSDCSSLAWPTAGANDHKGSARKGQRRCQLDEAAEQIWTSLHFHQSQAIPTNGNAFSVTDQISRPRLNPVFVEWMMGLPRGWTDFADSATESCLWRRRMRSCLFGLVSMVVKNERTAGEAD
jgi:hypothetical protein